MFRCKELTPHRLSLITALFILFSTSFAWSNEKVILQLRWDPQFQFAGYYAALWQGYYSDAGLDVEIRSAWKPDRSRFGAIEEVAKGRAHFGIGSSNILVARDQGIPLVALAPIFQKSPVEFYVRNPGAAFSPLDLIKMKVGLRAGDLSYGEFHAILEANSIDPTLVRIDTSGSSIARERRFMEGKLDVIAGYSIASPYRLKKLDPQPLHLHPNDFGIAFYGDTLFTSEALIHSNQDMVKLFTQASKKGWEYALKNPSEIAQKIAMELPRVVPIDDPIAYNNFQVPLVRELTLFPNVEIGHNNPKRWQDMYNAMWKAGLVSNPLDLDALLGISTIDENKKNWSSSAILSVAVFVILVLGIVLFFILQRVYARSLAANVDKLTREHSFHKSFLARQNNAIIQLDPNYSILFANKIALQLFELSPVDFVGKRLLDFLTEASQNELLSRLKESPQNDEGSQKFDAQIEARGKQPKNVWLAIDPVYNRIGKLVEVHIVAGAINSKSQH